MSAAALLRPLETLEFVANGEDNINIPRRGAKQYLICRLAGRLDVSGGTTDGTVHPEGPYSLIRQLQVIVDGKALLDLDGRFWRGFNQVMQSREPQTTNVQASVGNHTFEGFLIIPFHSERSVKPFETAFPSTALVRSDFRVRVQWGDTTSLVAGGDRSEVFGIAPTIEVFEKFNLRPNPIFKSVQRFRQMPFPSVAVGENRFALPEATTIRSVMVRADAGSGGHTADVAQDGIIRDITLESSAGVGNFDDVTDAVIREETRHLISWPGAVALRDGYHHMEFAENGRLGLSLNTSELSDPNLVVDVEALGSGTTRVWVAFQELVQPRAV